ncbi:MAG: peptide ABC transporter substrate-binding protein [Thermoactinomyces sp.]
MKKTIFLSLIMLLVGSVALTGCSSEAGKSGQILNLNITGEPTSLDPAQAFDEDSMDITNNLFVGLMRLDDRHQPQPALADKVEISEDGLTYTFHLKQTKWSNGQPLTAHDFEYAWKRVLDPDLAAKPAFLLYFIQGAEAYNQGKVSSDQVGIKASDDYTLQVKLAKPTPAFLELVAYPVFAPVSREALEQDPDMFHDAKNYVSNGAFKLAEWKHDNYVKLTKNEHFYKKDQAGLDEIRFSIITDNKTVYQLYQTKKLDVVGKSSIPADLLTSLMAEGKVKVLPGSGLSFFRFNVRQEPFTNKKIRKAFALAIDRKLIVEQIVGSGEEPAYAFVAPSVPGNFRQEGGNFIKDGQYEQAKQLLAEGMAEEGWQKLPPVTLMYSNATDKNKKIAEAVQEMIRKHLGVKIQLQAKEKKVYYADQENIRFVMSTSSFLADYNDAYNYLESFQTDHPMNRTNWSNEQYDLLLQKAAQASDTALRDQYLHQAEEILFEEMPVFPLYYYNTAFIEQPGIEGIIRHPVGPKDYTNARVKK